MKPPLVPPSIGISGAFILSVFMGRVLVVHGLQFFLEGKSDPHPLAWGVGYIERFIYTACIILGLPIELIGGWLVLKGLAQFKPRRDGKATTDELLNDYYSYLIGTGLSLIVGVGFGLLGRYLSGMELVPPKN
jgi:hypothetical protein